MSASNMILVLTLALESLCLWLAVRGRRAWNPLACFILYQLAFDLAYWGIRGIASGTELSIFYWAGHAPMYLLQLWVCRPEEWKGIFALYWIASVALMVCAIGSVWISHRDHQIALAMSCGAICLFVIIAGVLSVPGLVRWPVWAGMGLWAAAEAAGSMGSVNGGIVYRGFCIAALTLLALGAWQWQTMEEAYGSQIFPKRGREGLRSDHKSVHAWM